MAFAIPNVDALIYRTNYSLGCKTNNIILIEIIWCSLSLSLHSRYNITLLPLSTKPLNQSLPFYLFFFLFTLHPVALSPDRRWSSHLPLLSQLSHLMAKLEGNGDGDGRAWRQWRQWQILKATTAMTKFEGDVLLAWVCCRGLWISLTRVHLLLGVAIFIHIHEPAHYPPYLDKS